jgi:hypothetical protein
VYYDLADRYRSQGRASVTPFRAVEIDCHQPISADEQYDVGPARPSELAALAARIRSKRPAIYVEATGLAAPDLSIDPIVTEWQAAGLMRARHVLVVRGPSGWPVAGAVIDAVDDGIHLFGLLDMVRVYPLVEGGSAAYPALLTASQSWFRALGKQRFSYFADEEDDPLAAGRPGCSDLGSAFVTILPVTLLPELLEHVFTLTACCSLPSPGQAAR